MNTKAKRDEITVKQRFANSASDLSHCCCKKLSKPRFYFWIFAAIVAGYLAFQIAYIICAWLELDELQIAIGGVYHQIMAMPYRDFTPYKTVLGYYIETIPLFFVHDPWWRFIAIKIELAIINAAMLSVLAIFLKRMFGFIPAVCALLLLVLVPNFIIESSVIRVDMLTSWATIISLLFLLNKRYIWAGLFCGLGALISQKAAMHGIGCGLYFAGAILIIRDKRYIKYLIQFGIAAALVIVAYILFFGAFAGVGHVAKLVFAQKSLVHYTIHSSTVPNLYNTWIGLTFNAVLFSGLVLIAVIRLPLHWYNDHSNPNHLLLPLYCIGIIGVLLNIPRPYTYDYILIIPQVSILICMLFNVELKTWRSWPDIQKYLAILIFLIAGLYIPSWRILQVKGLLKKDNTAQRLTIQTGAKILKNGGTYLAGQKMFFNYKPALESFTFFDPDRQYHLAHDVSYKRLRNIYHKMMANNLKMIVFDGRINAFPALFHHLIYRNFAPWKYKIWLYAPLIDPNQPVVNIRFAGKYKVAFDSVQSNPSKEINKILMVDGLPYAVGNTIYLSKGIHIVGSSTPIRICLIPKNM